MASPTFPTHASIATNVHQPSQPFHLAAQPTHAGPALASTEPPFHPHPIIATAIFLSVLVGVFALIGGLFRLFAYLEKKDKRLVESTTERSAAVRAIKGLRIPEKAHARITTSVLHRNPPPSSPFDVWPSHSATTNEKRTSFPLPPRVVFRSVLPLFTEDPHRSVSYESGDNGSHSCFDNKTHSSNTAHLPESRARSPLLTPAPIYLPTPSIHSAPSGIGLGFDPPVFRPLASPIAGETLGSTLVEPSTIEDKPPIANERPQVHSPEDSILELPSPCSPGISTPSSPAPQWPPCECLPYMCKHISPSPEPEYARDITSLV
ncbi:hypothetical protein K488DRAFT_82378 [Vararia minispora EC-137]|uniref:Uncharacterized protein n=1 Tax=Vararia minispora EC-137 TaxID=1314806 RepID=A0ACB8QX22_9AGAM|nr:hypothetical protein K488DRAFT_82378 [Vararia minispora EC-137]